MKPESHESYSNIEYAQLKSLSSFLHVDFNVVAAGDKQIHQQALDLLQWK